MEKDILFDNVHKFREVLKDYTIQEGFILVKDKNEKSKVTCHCAAIGCPWRVHASPLPDGISFKIKSYNNEHTCVRHNKNKEATSTWIAKKLGDRLKENPEMKIDALHPALQSTYGIEAKKVQLHRARRKAIDELDGNHGESYSYLRMYANEILKSNPGSIVKIQLDRSNPSENPTFKRIFIAFDALKTGFIEGCRPFIGVDGCHLKGRYGGVLLSAIALDGKNGLFPLAFGVVESEGRDSWSFFLENLHITIGGTAHMKSWCFMSDMQKVMFISCHLNFYIMLFFNDL